MKHPWLRFLFQHRLYVLFALGGVILMLCSLPQQDTSGKEAPRGPSASVDTYIPKGYVLAPVEIANAESLSSLLGDVGGVVDLYLVSDDKTKSGQKVGSRLKILRAPLNPLQYAVLVKETDSPQILKHAGPFVAVIQNPQEKSSFVEKQAARTSIKINYQN